MSEISFRTTAKRNLPHLYYIFGKTEPPKIEFNTVSCYVTGFLIFIEVHRNKEGMKRIKYQKGLGATVACTKIMMEAKKGIGQKYRKRVTNDGFLFDSWFSLRKATEAAMDIGAEFIGMVNKNTKGF